MSKFCRDITIATDSHAFVRAADRTDEYICTAPPEQIRKAINRICRDNGLPDVGIHGLRHSFAENSISRSGIARFAGNAHEGRICSDEELVGALAFPRLFARLMLPKATSRRRNSFPPSISI